MQRTHSLEALFAVLVAGCGPLVSSDDDAGGGGTDDSDSGATDDVGTSSTVTTTSTGTSTTASTGSTVTTYSDEVGGNCWDEFQVFEVPTGTIEQWLDRTGQVYPEQCGQACAAAAEYVSGWTYWVSINDCRVYEGTAESDDGTVPPDPTGTGTTEGGDDTAGGGTDPGTSGSEGGTGDPTPIVLECDAWVCGGEGRGHEALQSTAAPTGGDIVGRWAAAAAHAEAASVGAFLALRDELVAHGAPPSLAARAADAARDEVAHARMMTRIATRRRAIPTRPKFGTIEVRALEAFAIENAVEGCVRETWSALAATHQARAAADLDIRAAMRRIATDETRHAELARDIDSWLRTKLDPDAIARVDDARDAAVAGLMRQLERRDDAALQHHAGMPSPQRAKHLAEGLHRALWS